MRPTGLLLHQRGAGTRMSAATASIPVPYVAAERPAINPWVVAVVVTLATFMELLDTAIANVALPHIAGGLALYSMAIVTAPAVGPPLGGWITDNWSWRWVFFINIPIGILSLILTKRLVSDPPEFTRQVEAARRDGRLKIDSLGIVLVALGFAGLEVFLDRAQTEDWFASNFILVFFSVAGGGLVIAVIWEWRHPDPVVEIRLFSERNFAIANFFYFLFGFTLFGSTVLIPRLLQSLYRYPAPYPGPVLVPG